MKRIEEAFRARDDDDLAPGELPAPMTASEARIRVDALRAALEAEPPPVEEAAASLAWSDLPAHLRDGVAPDDVPARVTALREALGGHRGGQRTPSHNGARPPVPDLDDGWVP